VAAARSRRASARRRPARDHAGLRGKGRLDLAAHEVGRLVQATDPRGCARPQPPRPIATRTVSHPAIARRTRNSGRSADLQASAGMEAPLTSTGITRASEARAPRSGGILYRSSGASTTPAGASVTHGEACTPGLVPAQGAACGSIVLSGPTNAAGPSAGSGSPRGAANISSGSPACRRRARSRPATTSVASARRAHVG
jgi:hypothetical protein